jgi:hypothetical protein
LRLINLPARTRETSRQGGGRTHSDLVWKAFTDLSSETRSTLPLQALKRVLRMVVPPPSVVKKQWQAKVQKCNGSPASIAEATVYPYEYRLQAVISAMRRSERSAMEEAVGEEVEQEQGSNVMERKNQNSFSTNDYVFVLRQFATTGYLTGSEQVIKEIERLGLAVDRKVYEARLATLAQWITTNLDIRRRFWAYQNMTRADERKTGSLAAVLSRSRLPGLVNQGRMPSFFPPEIARLLGDMLYSLRFKDALEYRQSTLDLLLRVAKEIERPEALNAILKAGYGIDLQFPDIPEIGIAVSTRATTKKGSKKRAKQEEEDWVEQVTRATDAVTGSAASISKTADVASATTGSIDGAEINVHAMNTLVDGLGASGDVWKMLQTFEVLGHPLGSQSAGPGRSESSKALDDTPPSTSTLEKVVRRTGTVTSTAAQHAEDADPPLTLSEALNREESSGERLSFFGLLSKTDDDTASSALPSFFNQAEYNGELEVGQAGNRRAEEFLSRPAMPTTLQARARDQARISAYERMDEHTILQVIQDLDPRSRHSYRSNTTTYQTLIRHSARHAAWKMKEDTAAAYAMYALGGHFVKDAAHEMMNRHNVFLDQWVQIREWALAQRSLVLRGTGATTSGTAGSYDSTSDVNKSLRLRLDAIESRKAWLRSKIYHPSLLVTPAMVEALVQALRTGKRLDGQRKRLLAQVVEDVQRCLVYLKEEWEVLTGRQWRADVQAADSGSKDAPPASTSASDFSSRNHNSTSSVSAPTHSPAYLALDHRDAGRKFQLSKHLSLLRRDIAGLEHVVEEVVTVSTE